MQEETRDRQRRIEENMGLVYTCAGRLRGKGVEYEELVQAGSVGLILACDRFDPSRGFRFSTYAVPLILGEMRRLFREGGSVRVSRRMRDLARRAREEMEQRQQRGLPLPDMDELATLLGISREDAALALSVTRVPRSLTMEERDRALIIRRYFQGKTQSQTAAELGMTQVQVSRREKKILTCLRSMLL